MSRPGLLASALFTLVTLLIAAACSIPTEPPPKEKPPEPTFQPGEYGGEPLPGTENLFNLVPSPDGERIALIRERTPGTPSDPRKQLWIVNRDGSNPRLISVNTLRAEWHPNGNQLVVTVSFVGNFSVHTVDLETLKATQWTGREDQRLSFPVVSSTGWFDDGRRLLVFVHQKAYQQPFERGLYVIDTQDSTTIGPLVEFMEVTHFGNRKQYVVGQKFLPGQTPPSGNFARYDFADSTWHWITDFPRDSLGRVFVDPPVPSPTDDIAAQARRTGNAKQLFLFRPDADGADDDARPITELGGDNPRWAPDGRSFIFTRDVHRSEGARYVPFRFDLETMEAKPLWPTLPDSVPDFPDLSTQTLSQTSKLR